MLNRQPIKIINVQTKKKTIFVWEKDADGNWTCERSGTSK